MTIETSPANDLFAGFNSDEKRALGVAIRRVEELEETRRITAGMAGQAQAIEGDLKGRGVKDPDVLREAAEAVAATASVQGELAGEVQDYRKLFGPDGKAAAAVGQYAQLLRNAHAGDVNALNHVQAARRELYEARDASAEPQAAQVKDAPPNEITPTIPERTRSVEPDRTEEEKQQLLKATPKAFQEALSTALPTAFADRYFRQGNKFVDARDAKHVILIDHGRKLQLPREFDSESVKAAVDVAEARSWSNMKVSGDNRFRQAVWLEAASRGIAVTGYKATESEQAWATKAADRHGKLNVVSENEAVKAFRDAKTPAERSKAAAVHPELKKAFAIEANYSVVSRQLQGSTTQEAFMKRMRENIAVDLAQGRELADIRLRRPMFKQNEYSRTQQREQDRGR